MALVPGGRAWRLHLKILFLQLCLVSIMTEERRECREQEYKDKNENCLPCRQCAAGQELSEECGFGYGEGARCVPCRASRFKEDRSQQKCKPCLHCVLLNRFQKANCSSTRNAVCGGCLPGFYRKPKLSGLQDLECVPCGDPPPPYEPHCGGRVDLVPLPSTVTSPRDLALAAVICSALATVLLSLFILCVIYCKRQLLEKKPASLQSPVGPFSGEELSCLDRRHAVVFSPQYCCHHTAGRAYGPGHLYPSRCCEHLCREALERTAVQPHRSQSGGPRRHSLSERHVASSVGSSQGDVVQGPPADFSEARLLRPAAAAQSDPHPQLCRPPPPESSSSDEEEQQEGDSLGLLCPDAAASVPLDGDDV